MKHIVINFKTNNNLHDFETYFQTLLDSSSKKYNNLVFCTNSLYTLILAKKYPEFQFANQSIDCVPQGAYTSAVSYQQLSNEKISFALLGHSEQYKYFGLTLKKLNRQILCATSLKTKTYVCFGNKYKLKNITCLANILFCQIKRILKNIDCSCYDSITFAYEPIYAIGSDIIVDTNFINKLLGILKIKLQEKYKYSFPILYGGNVTMINLDEIMNLPNIDGILLGRVGLQVNNVKEIIERYGKE